MPHEVVVVSGRTAELPCPVEASPQPTVTWLHTATSRGVPTVDGGRLSLAEGSSKLIISNVSDADAGNYSCLATNPAGNTTLVVTLLVLGEYSNDYSCYCATDFSFFQIYSGRFFNKLLTAQRLKLLRQIVLTAIMIRGFLFSVPPWFPDGNEVVVESAVGSDIVTQMNCTAEGSPKPTISWLKGPQLLSSSATPYLVMSVCCR